MQSVGIPRNITRGIIRNIVNYVLQNERNYTGTLQQRLNQIYRDISRNNIVFPILRIYGGNVGGRFNSVLRDIIELTLLYLEQGTPPSPSPSPVPTPPSRRQWSNWEDLGGIITSAPAVSSWQRNRLDVFARGQNQSLWHLYWDGSR